jgi:integrase
MDHRQRREEKMNKQIQNLIKNLKYVLYDPDRHGNDRFYVRRRGKPRLRIRETPGTPAFLLAVQAALDAIDTPHEHVRANGRVIVPGSLAALATKHFASMDFLRLDAASQRNRRNIIEECLKEKVSGCVFGDMPLLMEIKEKQDMAGAANNRRKYLSVMFTWALAQTPQLMQRNPARDVKSVGDETDGYYTWTDEDIVTYEAAHPVGSKARLALALLMFTGMRRQDAIRLGPPSIRNGLIEMTPKTTKGTNPELTYKPLLPELDEIIKATPVLGSKTFLVTSKGRPFTEAGFGNWFKARCMEAGLPQCTAHGLRKAAACRCADAGVSDHDMMQLFDWASPRMAAHYTRKANKKKATARTIQHLSRRQPAPAAGTTGEQNGAECVPPKVSHLKLVD